MLTGPEAMPVFGDGTVTPAEKKDIIAYVIDTRNEANPGGFSLGRTGTVTEGLLGWLGGLGFLVLIAMWLTAKRRDATSRLKRIGAALMSEFAGGALGPRRVIGTPSPAPQAVDTPVAPAEPPLIAEPPDTAHAKNAERIVAALFVLAFLAGCGFIAAYVGIEVGQSTIPKGANDVVAVLRSNLALGASLSVVLLALGTGSIIWVRHLTPDIEIEEQRHDLRSAPADRKAFQQDVRRGRGHLPGHPAAAAAPHAAARDRAAGPRAARAAA